MQKMMEKQKAFGGPPRFPRAVFSARRAALLVFLVCASMAQTVFPAQVREKDLAPRYREWLDLVSYIILPVEREVFLKLTTDRDRDIYIDAFWKQRDPTPGTPQNEFKDEHLKRFYYANSNLKRGTPRPGWMTDQGRIYILLGPPASIERFDSVAGIQPCQVWYYRNERDRKLPTFFDLVFYQRSGSGEYKLYNPASDGPASLLVDTEGLDVTNDQQIYEKIKELAPSLAGVSISMIPGQYPYNYQASPQNTMILADIFESPKRNINPTYATHFLNYKGIVSTEYLSNYIESTGRTAILCEPMLGIQFLNFSVTPKKISADLYAPKNQYYCDLKLEISLRKGDQIVVQYSKDFPFYFPEDRADQIRASGLTIEDSFPVIEGSYNLTVLLLNSVNKEFTVFEQTVAIPGQAESPQILGPFVGFRLESAAGAGHVPFQALDKQISLDPTETLGLKDDVAFMASLINIPRDLWKTGELAVSIQGSKKESSQKSFTLKLVSSPYASVLPIAHAFPASELAPDYYEIRLTLRDADGRILDSKTSNFVVSSQDIIPHPVTLAKSFPLLNAYLYFYSLANEYDKAGNPRKAGEYYEKGRSLRPDYQEGVAEYAGFLVRQRDFDRALEMAKTLETNEKLRFDYFLLRGQALTGKELYREAIVSLLEGNKIYNSDTRLLNTLGFCFYKTRQKKEALDALNASLRLNPAQADVKEMIAKVEKELK
jgi:GWxTD domain-containing protein